MRGRASILLPWGAGKSLMALSSPILHLSPCPYEQVWADEEAVSTRSMSKTRRSPTCGNSLPKARNANSSGSGTYRLGLLPVWFTWQLDSTGVPENERDRLSEHKHNQKKLHSPFPLRQSSIFNTYIKSGGFRETGRAAFSQHFCKHAK